MTHTGTDTPSPSFTPTVSDNPFNKPSLSGSPSASQTPTKNETILSGLDGSNANNAPVANILDSPATQGGISAAVIVTLLVVGAVVGAFIKANKTPTKLKRTEQQPDTKTPIVTAVTVASAATPIAGAILGPRIPMEGARIGFKAPAVRTSPVLAAAQATMQVARNPIASHMPAVNKTQLNPNLMKQFEAYDRSHFQAQRVRQQSRMPAVRPSGPRVSVTQVVQSVVGNNPIQTIPKSRVEFNPKSL
jgi:hypothetical protein